MGHEHVQNIRCPLQDIGFPYMLDPHHCQDTLFLVFESDFRFYERDDLPTEKWLPLAVAARHEHSMREQVAMKESEDEGEASMEVDAVGGARRPPQTWASHPGEFAGALQSSCPNDKEYIVQDEIVDLVQLCNVAAREDGGDIVWLGWNGADPSKKARRAHSIKCGANLIAYTPNGARKCLRAIKIASPTHYDMWLLCDNLNVRATARGQAKSCYVIQPVGGMAAHERPHEQRGGFATRPSSWGEKWCQESTRPHGPSHKHRWLARFTRAGDPDWLAKVELPPPGTELHWATEAPPAHWRDPDNTWRCMLRFRGWVSEQGLWIGPARYQSKGKALKGKSSGLSPRERGKRSGNSQAKGKQVPLQRRLLVEEPDGYNTDANGVMSPITRLAELLVTSPFDEAEWATTAERGNRARAFRVSQYKQRFFVEGPSEVRRVQSDCCRTLLRCRGHGRHRRTHTHTSTPFVGSEPRARACHSRASRRLLGD